MNDPDFYSIWKRLTVIRAVFSLEVSLQGIHEVYLIYCLSSDDLRMLFDDGKDVVFQGKDEILRSLL